MTAPLSYAVFSEYISIIHDSLPALRQRLDEITNGRVAPSVEDLAIGTGRNVKAVVIFFDIRGFTLRTSSSDIGTLKETLFMLNCVLPAMMRVLFRHGAYVEKNTGDGLMAIMGVGSPETVAASDALSACSEMMLVLREVINPILMREGVAPVDARIGVDFGDVILARIGVPRGSAAHDRSSLTAVGPAANIACKLQGMAGTNEIYCGDRLREGVSILVRDFYFTDVTPQDWTWQYSVTGAPYSCWRYSPLLRRPEPAVRETGGLLKWF